MTDPLSTPSTSQIPRPPGRVRTSLTVGLYASFVVTTAGVLAQAIAWNTTALHSCSLYAGFLAVAFTLLLRFWIDRFAQRHWRDAAPAALWLGLCGAAIGLGAGLASHLESLMSRSYALLRPYNTFWEMEPEVFLAPLCAFIAGAVSFAVIRSSMRWARARGLRMVALVVAAVGVVLTSGASYRSHHGVTLDHYLASLPVVGSSGDISALASDLTGDSPDGFSRRSVDARIGPWVVRRYLFESHWLCPVRIARTTSELPARIPRPDSAFAPCTSIELRRDDAHRLIFASSVSPGPYELGPAVFDLRTLEPVDPSRAVNATVADGLALPHSWILATWALLLVALAVLALPSRARQWLARQSKWRAGILGADRVIRFDDDGSSAPCPVESTVAPGPVVVIDATSVVSRGDPFRAGAQASSIRAHDVIAGPIADAESHWLGALGAHDAFALAVALAAVAMVGAAALNGLVF